MRRSRLLATTAILGGALGGLLGGCGSSATKTVTISNAPTTQSTATSAPKSPRTETTATTPTSTTPAQTTTNGGTSAPTTTRTSSEPAFAQQEAKGSEGVSSAAAVLRAHGYTPNNTSEYHPSQTLAVLIGTRTGSTNGYEQQAFFFLGGKYIGTDTKEPSATVKVLSQSDTEVTLAYPLYRPGDSVSSPSGGQATVNFQLNDGKLTPLESIPPAHSSSGVSRN